MDGLSDAQADTAEYNAPRALSVKWMQMGLKRASEYWAENRPDDYAALDTAVEDCGHYEGLWFIEINNFGTGTGQYGHFSEFELQPRVDKNIISEDNPHFDLAVEFTEEWVKNIRGVIREVQSKSALSPKEFVAYVSTSNPKYGEQRVADALGITVGTLRGKLGRINKKLEEARQTVALEDDIERFSNNDRTSFQSGVGVLTNVDEEDLPISAMEHRPKIEGKYEYTIKRVGRDEEFNLLVEDE